MNEIMDVEEWELILPDDHEDDGFLEIIHQQDYGAKKHIYSRTNYSSSNSIITSTSGIFKMNYFNISPPPKPSVENTLQQIIPPVLVLQQQHQEEEEEAPSPTDDQMVPPTIKEDPIISPRVVFFFNKMKETEFKVVDSSSNSRGMEFGGGASFEFDEEKVDTEEENAIHQHQNNEGSRGRWSLCNGIGAICSFGMAAAVTVCIILVTASKQNTTNNNNKNPLLNTNHHKIQFQIYTNDKRMNQAISAVRGGLSNPNHGSRARLTFGGYYDAPTV